VASPVYSRKKLRAADGIDPRRPRIAEHQLNINLSLLDEVAQERAAAEKHRIVQIEPIAWPKVSRAIIKVVRSIRRVRYSATFAEFGRRSILDEPSEIVGRESIAISDGVHIHAYGRLEALNCDEDIVRLRIGSGTVAQRYLHIGAISSVMIGKGCLLASHVYITDHDHDFSNPLEPPISNRRVIAAPVTIGDYVWLGENVTVLKGVKIGQRSVIGAGSIVTRDVPEFSIAVGSPARVIRKWDQITRQWMAVEL
jgi:acetyltransferase-like isoleucine patch superfamily enzyme